MQNEFNDSASGPNASAAPEQSQAPKEQNSRPAQQSSGGQSQVPSIGTHFREAWELMKRHAGTLAGVYLVVLALQIVVYALSFFGSLDAQGAAFAGIGIFIVGLISLIVSLWAHVSTISIFLRPDEEWSVTKAYGTGKGYLLGYIGLTIAGAIIVGIGFVLFIIPGVILAVWFSLAAPVYVAERTGVIQAFSSSREYVRNYFGTTFLRLLAVIVLMFVVNFVVMLPFGAPQEGTALYSAQSIVSSLVGIVLGVFFAAYIVRLYTYLRKVKGGSNDSSSEREPEQQQQEA